VASIIVLNRDKIFVSKTVSLSRRVSFTLCFNYEINPIITLLVFIPASLKNKY
jgi:hypothetical protein